MTSTLYDNIAMSEENDIQSALNSAYYYLKFRPRTKSEVEKNLIKKSITYKWSPAVIEKTILHLEEVNMINDRDFIEWFVSQRNKSKQKSNFALRNELMKHGIAKDLLDEYFSEHTQDEEELGYQALQKKWNRFKHYDHQTRLKKSAAFLASRGFSFEIVKKAIDRLEEDEKETS